MNWADVIIGLVIVVINLVPMVLGRWRVLYFTIVLSVILGVLLRMFG